MPSKQKYTNVHPPHAKYVKLINFILIRDVKRKRDPEKTVTLHSQCQILGALICAMLETDLERESSTGMALEVRQLTQTQRDRIDSMNIEHWFEAQDKYGVALATQRCSISETSHTDNRESEFSCR